MLIGHSAPTQKEKANELVDKISMEITFTGQSKKEITDDAKRIAEILVSEVKNHVPHFPYEKVSSMKDDARRWWDGVSREIKKI